MTMSGYGETLGGRGEGKVGGGEEAIFTDGDKRLLEKQKEKTIHKGSWRVKGMEGEKHTCKRRGEG